MTRFFASRRRRRRAVWLAILVVVGSTIASLVVWVGDTGNTRETFTPGAPKVYKQPTAIRLSRKELGAIHATAVRFIRTAVARRHIEDSWEITHPELKVGYTRKSWGKGNIPAVPYQAETPEAAPWRVAYSYEDDVDLYVALLPKKGSHLRPMAFSIELKALGDSEHRRWLVSSWVPLGGSSPALRPEGSTSAQDKGVPVPNRAPLSSTWLLVPLALLGLIILIPVAVGLREWWRGVKAKRAYPPGRSPFEL